MLARSPELLEPLVAARLLEEIDCRRHIQSRAVSVEVEPVASRRDLREFIELPYRLHSNAEQWIPPLRIERRLFLDPRFNAFFKHGEAQLFLARRDGRVVGRSAPRSTPPSTSSTTTPGACSASSSSRTTRRCSRPARRRRGLAAERGRDRMVGPMDFTMNDESGVLIEGFEREPMIRQPWHPPYYQRLCEAPRSRRAWTRSCGSSTSPAARR